MRKNKNNYAVWSSRIKKQTSNNFKKIGSSINIDKRLYKEDIQGSIVHTEMLYKQKIISLKVKAKILWGLNRIKNEIEKKKFKFDISKDNFAWIANNKIEKKMISVMKKGSRIMITGYNKSGSQTIDHYSLMGFTKAYNSAKKNCS